MKVGRLFVGEKSDEFIGMKKSKLTNNEKFSCDLVIILARKREVVAVHMTTYSDSCIINISKNSNWLQGDYQYINKIKEYLIKISKYKFMTWKEAFTKHDTMGLAASVFEYCSGRFESRLKKLKDDIKNAGATYTDQPAVIDGNIITARHPKDVGDLMKAIFSKFK